MNKLIVFVVAITLASTGYAGNGNGNGHGNGHDKNGNASHGTKALLERIEALEAALASLDGSGGGVSGGSYFMITETNHLWAGNEFPAHGAGFSLGRVILDFYSDGSGNTMVLSCGGNRLHDPDFNDTDIAYFVPIEACQTQDVGFSYVQEGSQLSVQYSSLPFPVMYTVSENGESFMAGNVYSQTGVPCEDSACTLSTAGTIVNSAMRIGASE